MHEWTNFIAQSLALNFFQTRPYLNTVNLLTLNVKINPRLIAKFQLMFSLLCNICYVFSSVCCILIQSVNGLVRVNCLLIILRSRTFDTWGGGYGFPS